MADRVGRFASLRLGLRCGPEEAGRARKSEGGGTVAPYSSPYCASYEKGGQIISTVMVNRGVYIFPSVVCVNIEMDAFYSLNFPAGRMRECFSSGSLHAFTV